MHNRPLGACDDLRGSAVKSSINLITMTETIVKDIWIQGMHCDACEKTITKALGRIGVEVEDIRYTSERVELRYDPAIVPFSKVREAIANVGYSASETSVQDRDSGESLSERVRRVKQSFFKDPAAYTFEKNVIKSTLGTLVVVAALAYFTYFVFFWNVESFWGNYGQYIGYLIIAVVATGGGIRHLGAFFGGVVFFTGMMIGMTIGMISGLLLGIVIGTTNGMFVGSVFGMIIGMGVGGWVGACCGIMGIMEGMMAGLMGGTMGAMTAVMMFSDRLTIFLPIFFVATLMILAGMSYLVYKEHKHGRQEVRPYGFWPYTLLNFAVVLAGIL